MLNLSYRCLQQMKVSMKSTRTTKTHINLRFKTLYFKMPKVIYIRKSIVEKIQ